MVDPHKQQVHHNQQRAGAGSSRLKLTRSEPRGRFGGVVRGWC